MMLLYLVAAQQATTKFFIAAMIATNIQGVPPQGWIQMLSASYPTKQECMASLKENEYMLYRSIMITFKDVVKGIVKFGCFTEDDIKKMNEDLGHDIKEYKDVDVMARRKESLTPDHAT